MWRVDGWPYLLTRNQAITALTLAEWLRSHWGPVLGEHGADTHMMTGFAAGNAVSCLSRMVKLLHRGGLEPSVRRPFSWCFCITRADYVL